MSFTPISNDFIQYQAQASGTSAAGYFLKLYAAGTNTPISTALDSAGSVLVAKVELDSLGFAKNGSGGATTLYIDQAYRLVLYVNATDADNNTFGSAVQDIDDIPQIATLTGSGETVKSFATLEGGSPETSAVENTNLVAGDALNIAERTAGNGGGAMWDVVLSSTVTENTFNIVQATGVGTLSLVLRLVDDINAKAAGLVGDGVADDTAALQALTAAALLAVTQFISFPAGAYLIKDTITASASGLGLVFKGQTDYINGFVAGNNLSRILFQPATVKDLFVFDGTTSPAIYGSKCGIYDISISGTTTLTGDNSRYCINILNMAQCEFRNVGIERFESGVFSKDCMDNDYNRLYIQSCATACVEYTFDSGLSTTDTWESCRLATSQTYAIIIKDGISFKFNNCIIENNALGIANIFKEAFSIEFNHCHCEDNPTDATATNTAFRVGADGTTLAPDNTIMQVLLGHYTGRAAGAVGAWLSVDFCDMIKVVGPHVRGYTRGIETTANTSLASVFLSQPNFTSVSTPITETVGNRVFGIYALTQLNGGSNPLIKIGVGQFQALKVTETVNYNGAVQVLTGAGAVIFSTMITHIATTGANALTLADATTDGHLKYIVMTVDGGDGTLTPTNLGNGTTITFNDVGDSATLLFTNNAWHFMGGTATLA